MLIKTFRQRKLRRQAYPSYPPLFKALIAPTVLLLNIAF
jgi:hypothetical protein